MKIIMRFTIAFLVLLIASSCSSQVNGNNTTVRALSEKTADSNSNLHDKSTGEAFYGDWVVKKELTSGPASIYDNEEIRNIIGLYYQWSKYFQMLTIKNIGNLLGIQFFIQKKRIGLFFGVAGFISS